MMIFAARNVKTSFTYSLNSKCVCTKEVNKMSYLDLGKFDVNLISR